MCVLCTTQRWQESGAYWSRLIPRALPSISKMPPSPCCVWAKLLLHDPQASRHYLTHITTITRGELGGRSLSFFPSSPLLIPWPCWGEGHKCIKGNAHTPWARGKRTANKTKMQKCTYTLHQGCEEPGDSDIIKLCQTCSYTVLRDDMISLFLRRWYQKILHRNYSNWEGLEKCRHSSNLISIQTRRVRQKKLIGPGDCPSHLWWTNLFFFFLTTNWAR